MDIQIKKKPFLLRYKYYILGAAVLFLLLIYLLGASVGPSKLRQDIENLQISEVKEGKFLEYLDVEGIAQPKLTVKLNSLESGIVERIVAEDGSMLKKGDTILVLINPELLRTIDDERDNLEKQRISQREKLLQMEQKTSELKRSTMKTVYDLNRLSKQYELDKEEYAIGIRSKAQLDVSADEYAYNQKNARLLLEELKQDSAKNAIQRDLLRNDMEREEKKYLRSKERLDNLVVRAPIDGQLSFLNVIPGERVNAGTNIGEQKEMENMKVTAAVSEYYIDRISLGLPASITYKNEKYPLVISKINPEIKERNFDVDFLFTDKVPDNVRIGKTYRLQIEMGQPEDALVINKGNFYQSTGGQWIFKLNKDKTRAVRTNIVIGRQNPLQYEVLDGLKPGDQVIISGYNNFGDVQELVLE
ncbi:efflux RND transporter periplasmic adaptor subunit [Dysgonomonas sp. 25]|uniref:efflux RND transporter periplasmic adaptor subunit n=1 Tax=Dysgonomonas sp. 25 TaxID=2302933 RepID=UPI0013D37DF5|nr:efflux RND transporter periplasmic adaptor subunit [Dysgonomonas sp. 25]NDV68828.1 efflux RND transporter periplasmic adaptor subunit [Dysgonomonas sp. 25]